MKVYVESSDDIIEKKVQKDGRLYLGKDYADKKIQIAILEVEDDE